MKRLIAMFAVFGLTALIAAYVALAPNAASNGTGPVHAVLGALDGTAAQLIAIRGRSAAVLGILGLGIVVSVLVTLAVDRDGSGDASARPTKRQARASKEHSAPGPVWRPEPLAPEDRIASLRRRAAHETDAPPKPLPRPVILARKPRERERDWFSDQSWLGGLPRLGDAEWPRDSSGKPLPFAAQIDLTELAAACPETPLPWDGSLAFFLGTGAVVAVPSGTFDFSDPPQDLPPAFEEGGYPFPARPDGLSRYFFPYWPVEPYALDLSDNLRDHRDGRNDEAIEQAMAELLSHHIALRTAAFAAPDDTLWWHGVGHLAEQIHIAFDASTQLVASQRDSVHEAEDALARLESAGDADTLEVEAAREELDERQASLAAIESRREGLSGAVTALDHFAAERSPWQQLTQMERDVIADLLAELHTHYDDLVHDHVPRTVSELATLSLRTMITGTPEALAAIPEDQLARINHDFRLPMKHQHQVFGLGARQQTARDEHRRDILLLQLGYDDMMEWRWGEMGLFQFWISPEDAANGRWDAVRLTFESA